MENQLIIIAIVIIFSFAYILLYFFFTSKNKRQELEIVIIRQERDSLNEKIQNNETLSLVQESKNTKSKLVYEQVKKIEYLESEVQRQRKRINELKLVAQSASMAQQHFLSNITAEITRPIEEIQGFSTLLNKRAKDESSSKILYKIQESSNKLLNMLSDIVDLSKIEAKTFKIKEERVDIQELLSSLIEKKQKIAQKKSLLLSLEVDRNLPPYLILDASKVEDILENLIDNAINFTQSGYVKVNVLVDETNVGTNTMKLSFYVEDTGAGITQAFEDKVFGVFDTAEKTEDKISQTVGLSLSISKKIALMMHGNITFKSEVSKGSVFRFSLSEVEIPLWSSNERVEDTTMDFSLLRENAKVMLVSELNKDHQIVVDAFKTSEVILFSYSEFREAIKTLKSETLDLILIDVEILNNDEGAVSKVLASSTKAPVIPLVKARVKEMKFPSNGITPSGFLKKPLLKSELFKISYKLLNK